MANQKIEILTIYNPERDILAIDYDQYRRSKRNGFEIVQGMILGVDPRGRILEVHIKNAAERLQSFGDITSDNTFLLRTGFFSRVLAREKIPFVINRTISNDPVFFIRNNIIRPN